jgi:hypothetical protein
LRGVNSTAKPTWAAIHVCEDVALDQHAPRVLQLEKVLDRPLSVVWRGGAPRQRLHQLVAAHDDVRRDQIGDARIAAAEHEIFSGGLEMVVLDGVRAGPVPSGNRLRVVAVLFEVGEVRVGDRRRRRVERDAPPRADLRISVDVQPIEDEVMRNRRRLRRRRAEIDHVRHERARGRRHFEIREPVVVRARLDGNDRPAGGDEPRQTHVIRIDAAACS